MKRILISCIKAYRLLLSPWLGNGCRFEPTCSEYAKEAILTHGAFKGFFMGFYRVLRCNPFGKGGYDPVPPKKETR